MPRTSYQTLASFEACIECGAEEDVTVRADDEDISEPLCPNCWYEWDDLADRIYCENQFAFYNQEAG